MNTPEQIAIDVLLSSRNRFEIPRYQSPHTWERAEITNFIEDLREAVGPHERKIRWTGNTIM
jgi:predicted RNA methylase